MALAVLLLPLLLFFASSPAVAWTSYSANGFQKPTVLHDSSGNDCPGKNCKNVQQMVIKSDVIVCPNVTTDATSGKNSYNTIGLVRRVMPCIKETMLSAANDFLGPVVAYVSDIIAAASTLAIALLGVLMIGGRTTAVWRDSMVLAVKLGGVAFATHNLTATNPGDFSIFASLLDMMDDLVWEVISAAGSTDGNGNPTALSFPYYRDCIAWTDPNYNDANTVLMLWNFLDCNLEILLGGILQSGSLQYGILAFLLGCILSKGFGATIGMLGFYMLSQLIKAIMRALYIFISGYMGIALCIIIAPFFIPTILFNSTKTYFFGWVRALGGFMLQPVIVAAYLMIMLVVFDAVFFTGPNSVVRALVGSSIVDETQQATRTDAQGKIHQYQSYTFLNQPTQCDSFGKNCQKGGKLGGWLSTHGGFAGTTQVEQTNVILDSSKSAPPGRAYDFGALNYISTIDSSAISTDPTGKPTYLGISLPVDNVVSWQWLLDNAYTNTGNQNYNEEKVGEDTAMNNYILDVFKSMLMAFLTSYIFLQLLDVLPFLGAGLSMGIGNIGGARDAKTFGASGTTPSVIEATKK